MTDDGPDGDFEAFLDAVDAGRGYYLRCPRDHGSLPPRRVCPECGERSLTKRPLPDHGTVTATTRIEVAPPAFAPEAPYLVCIADFGPVRITGRVPTADVDVGATVRLAVAGGDDRIDSHLLFEPIERPPDDATGTTE
ncbi:MAG: Zn-ribbon domain-containing OB-fold protein [Haloarculaceae archaeon]